MFKEGGPDLSTYTSTPKTSEHHHCQQIHWQVSKLNLKAPGKASEWTLSLACPRSRINFDKHP